MNLKQLILNILSSHHGLEERGEGKKYSPLVKRADPTFSLPSSPTYTPASSGSSRRYSPPKEKSSSLYYPEQLLFVGAMTEYDLWRFNNY